MACFHTDLERGALGERAVIDLMVSRGHQVVDIRADKDAQNSDIDFLIDGVLCELKTDFVCWRTGNLFLEDILLYSNNTDAQGWFRKTEAEFLFYLDWENKQLHIYRMADLRAYICEHKRETPLKFVDDGYKRVYGYCVPISALAHQLIALQEVLQMATYFDYWKESIRRMKEDRRAWKEWLTTLPSDITSYFFFKDKYYFGWGGEEPQWLSQQDNWRVSNNM